MVLSGMARELVLPRVSRTSMLVIPGPTIGRFVAKRLITNIETNPLVWQAARRPLVPAAEKLLAMISPALRGAETEAAAGWTPKPPNGASPSWGPDV